MDISVFQLLPRGGVATDREVIEQALWEVDFAERHGFELANNEKRRNLENAKAQTWKG
jgi:hypothetical protein